MTIQIEKGIPLTKISGYRPGRPKVYPFDEMEVGDSFVISVEKQSNVNRCAKSRGFKIKTRRIDSTENVRVWLIGKGEP